MKNLWIFGDSFSDIWRINRDYSFDSQEKYLKWFKKQPVHFSDILNKKFKFDNIYNKARSGADNYTILESIGEEIKNIKKDDWVCIGWSYIGRYRMVNDKNDWFKIQSGLIDNNRNEQLFMEQIINRTSNDIIFYEIKHWQNILLKALPKQTIFWSPFEYSSKYHEDGTISFFCTKNITTIKKETKGYIDDLHFSSEGHEQVGNQLIEHWTNQTMKII